jgi:hypothetical protein
MRAIGKAANWRNNIFLSPTQMQQALTYAAVPKS